MKHRIGRAVKIGFTGAFALVLVASLIAPRVVRAELGGAPSVSATATAVTTTLTTAVKSISFYSEGTDDVRLHVYNCDVCGGRTTGEDGKGQGTACSAITFATGTIELESTQGADLTHDRATEGGRGYCGYSVICDTGDSATVRVIYK